MKQYVNPINIFIVLLITAIVTLVIIPLELFSGSGFTANYNDIGYVDNPGSGSATKSTTDTFDLSATFSLYLHGKEQGDAQIGLTDANGVTRYLYYYPWTWRCGDEGLGENPTQLIEYTFSEDVYYEVTSQAIYLKKVSDDSQLGYIVRDGTFGEQPFKITGYVSRARGTRCSNSGISYRYGTVSVSNILFENADAETGTTEESTTTTTATSSGGSPSSSDNADSNTISDGKGDVSFSITQSLTRIWNWIKSLGGN